MNLESEISKKEKNNYYILMYICEIWKKDWYRCSYLQSRNRDADIENKYMDTKGEEEVGWIGRLGLLCIH